MRIHSNGNKDVITLEVVLGHKFHQSVLEMKTHLKVLLLIRKRTESCTKRMILNSKAVFFPGITSAAQDNLEKSP